jgi:hypothetical protein
VDDPHQRRYGAEIWRRYLTLLDQEISEPRSITVIGGGALALKHDPRYATRDLDTATSVSGDFEKAVQRAAERLQAERQLALAPPVSRCAVMDAPYSYEDRLERVDIEGLRHLRVFVPEVHDLALMKAARFSETDIRALLDVHAQKPFDLPTLVERYGEMDATGTREHFRTSVYLLTQRLYGTHTAKALQPHLELVDSAVGGGTVEERRALGSDARWQGAVQDALDDLRGRAVAIAGRVREDVGALKARIQAHAEREPIAPSPLDRLRGAYEERSAARSTWEHERHRLEQRLHQIEGRESFVRDLTLNPVQAGALARERAAQRHPELARGLEQTEAVVSSLKERQRQHQAERGLAREPQIDRDR